MIDLSVIIPVYNAAPSINRTLDSIFNLVRYRGYSH